MYSFLMQDWGTIRMQFGQAYLIQTEANWLDLQAYEDVVFWLEVREASLATGTTPPTSLRFDYETAPFKDESMFKLMISSATFTGAIATPDVQKVTLATSVPLARWVRWKLFPVGGTGTTGASDVTFRIAVSANLVGGR